MIERIKLLISVNPGCASDCTRWGELDNVLMGSPEGWPALREVSLSFIAIMTSRDGTDEAIRNLRMTKMKESNRARIQIDFEVRAFIYDRGIHRV